MTTAADNEHKRDEDRDDTQLALDNTRWDAEHKRDEDRQDTADALSHSRQDAALAVEWTLYQAVHNGYIAVVQNSLDRSIQRGTYITTAAASIVTLYTGLIAVRFSTSSKSTLLPARGLLPALFLGAAVVFSTFFLAFLRKRTMVLEVLPSGLGGDIPRARLLDFIEWVMAGVVARAWSLRVAVISLGLGLILLPIAFIQLSSDAVLALGIAAAGVLGLWIIGEFWLALWGTPRWFTSAFTARGHRFAPMPPDVLPTPPPGPYPPTPLERAQQAGDRPAAPEHQAGDQPPDPQDDAGAKPPRPQHHAGAKPSHPEHHAGDQPSRPQHQAPPPDPQHHAGN